MKRRMKSALVLLTAITLGIFSSCTSTNEDVAGGSNSTKGSLKILLTDAPFPSDLVDEVNVVIDEVSIKKVSDDSSEGDESGWSVLTSEESSFNLLDLQNGAVAVLADFEDFPIGTYSEIRLHIVSAEVVLTAEAGGETFDLKIPSGTSSGLKVKINGNLEVRGGNPAALIVDFDVAKSFLVQGNPTKNGKEITGFKFKPVIRATAEDISGTIEGYVSFKDFEGETEVISYKEGTPVEILDGENNVVTTAFTEADGFYSVIGLLPSNYKVSCAVDGYHPVIVDAEVKTNEITTVDIEMVQILPGAVTGVVSTTQVIEGVETVVPLAGATVKIYDASDVELGSVATIENGSYGFTDLMPGTYKVVCSLAGYNSFEGSVEVIDATTTTLDISLTVGSE